MVFPEPALAMRQTGLEEGPPELKQALMKALGFDAKNEEMPSSLLDHVPLAVDNLPFVREIAARLGFDPPPAVYGKPAKDEVPFGLIGVARDKGGRWALLYHRPHSPDGSLYWDSAADLLVWKEDSATLIVYDDREDTIIRLINVKGTDQTLNHLLQVIRTPGLGRMITAAPLNGLMECFSVDSLKTLLESGELPGRTGGLEERFEDVRHRFVDA